MVKTVTAEDGKENVVIVGAGLAGLVCAYRLSKSQAYLEGRLKITVLDSAPRAGGVIESLQIGDCLIESGPDSFITNKPFMLDLCRELGIEKRIVPVNKKNRGAMVVKDGKLYPLPEGFIMLAPSQLIPFALSPVLSLPGKLRAVLDLVLPARNILSERSQPEESLAQFVRRRFGAEVLERLAQPMVAGVYVGDAEKLSADMVAERFVKMERTAGSVIRGLMSERSEANSSSGARYGLFASFDGGLSVVVEALLAAMADRVNFRFNCPVLSVKKNGSGYQVNLRDGESLNCEHLVLGAAASICAKLLSEDGQGDPLSKALASIGAASSAVINFVFEKNQINHPLNAFGAVIPEQEIKRCGFTIIAFSFASMKYQRAPENKVILRAFVGGVKGEAVVNWSDEVLFERALSDLNKLLGLKGHPSHKAVHRWPTSMPQYEVGHSRLLAQIEEALPAWPGLYLTGNSYVGVGLPDCVNSGCQTAEKLLAKLKLGQLSV